MYNALEQAEVILQGMALGVPAGQLLSGVFPGDKVRVKATVQFRGLAYSDKFYAAIGNFFGVTWPTDIGLFDEIWETPDGGVPVSFAQSDTWVTYELTADILIKQVGILPWTPSLFDVYAKLVTKGLYTPYILNQIQVQLKPEFQNFSIASYERIAG